MDTSKYAQEFETLEKELYSGNLSGAELTKKAKRHAFLKPIIEKEREIDALRWNWLEEQTFLEPFDINALFSYLARTEMLERWSLLDVEQGMNRFTEIIENLRGSAKVPEEFIRK